MKKIAIVIVVFTIFQSVHVYGQDSPNFNEWFRQKSTQIRYLVQQIAALKVYLGYLQKGYKIVDKGLTTIGGSKGSAFDQDKAYLRSLREVSPVVRNSPQIKAILVYQREIVAAFRRLARSVASSIYFTNQEKEYITTIHRNMLTACNDSVEELTLILTAGQAEMEEDERFVRLDSLHEDLLDKYSFTKSFVSSTELLSMQRAKEHVEIKNTDRLFLEL